MADPESDVLAKIATMAAWTEDTNLFRGPVYADENFGDVIPREAAFVTCYGGPKPISLFPDASVQERWFNVQVIVRGDPGKYGSTRTLAQNIYDTLHDSSISGYWYVRCDNAHPEYAGQDEKRSHLFVVNLTLRNAA